MVQMHPDWNQPFANGWAVQLVVIVEGDAVGCISAANVPEGITREFDSVAILDRLVKCFADWLFDNINVSLWERFASQVLAGFSPPVRSDLPPGKGVIARMRESQLIYGQFKSEVIKAIAEALTPHLTEWWETELEELILRQLEEAQANQEHYVFTFPPDELAIVVEFPTAKRLHSISADEPSIKIKAGARFALSHKISMFNPGRLVLRLGDKLAK